MRMQRAISPIGLAPDAAGRAETRAKTELTASPRRWRLYLVLAGIVLAFVLLGLQSYRSVDAELTEAALARRSSLALLAATMLSEKFDRLTDIGVSLATRVQLRERIVAGRWDEAARILRSVPSDFDFIERLSLTDVHGTLMADVPQLEGVRGANFAYRDWYKQVSRSWKPEISPIYKRAAVPQRNVLAVAVPVRGSDGQVLGILILQVKLEAFFEWARTLDVGPGGFVYVVDNKGHAAFHPEIPAQGEIADLSRDPVVRQLLRGAAGILIGVDPVSRKEHVIAFAPVKRGWGIVTEQPADAAFASRDNQLRRVLIGYLALLFFCIAVIYLATRLLLQRRLADADRHIKAELERLVAKRTAQLESANKELESFSFSVSHDLRAPLRAVSGFSQMLQEDYGGRLDEEGRRLLKVVRDGCAEMGRLIDDLLEFSRLGRAPMSAAAVDMAQLAGEVFEMLRPGGGAPAARFELKPMPAARGDRALLRQVWVNLLSNALKFSAGAAQPLIEAGGEQTAGEHVYWVKDNGAGFDMRYYDKLFGVFQRLHRAEEFPGTGVGLAIVQRVVARHGGRVWAEGRVGAGADFYFALPTGGADERV